MATHPGVLAWSIPWTEEPGRIQPTGSQRVEHDSATKQQQQCTVTCTCSGNARPSSSSVSPNRLETVRAEAFLPPALSLSSGDSGQPACVTGSWSARGCTDRSA